MIKQNSENNIITDINNTTKMQLLNDPENMAHIVKVLTENYKYPIASTIRETASNAYDSHLMSGKSDIPFVISLSHNTLGNYTLEIQDFGLGLSEEEFYKYYMQIGSSNKRNVKGVLGYYGCGAKAALSIDGLTHYEVICRKEGVENKFIIFKGEEFPECTLLSTELTDLEDGVIVRLDINNYNYRETVIDIKTQLCYFPNVLIKLPNETIDFNSFKIYENELFSCSELYPLNELHINFGNVYYPIDWSILKLKPIRLPLGIKINPDGIINPFFNRESLEYNKQCKELILSKIKEIATYLCNKFNTENNKEVSFSKSYEYYTKGCFINVGDKIEIPLNEISVYSDVEIELPKIKNTNFLTTKFICTNLTYHLLAHYEPKLFKDNFTKRKAHLYIIDCIKNNIPIYISPNKTVPIHILNYLDSIHNKYLIVNLNETKKYKVIDEENQYNYKTLHKILDLYNYEENLWTEIIQEWINVEQDIIDTFLPLPVVEKEKIVRTKKPKIDNLVSVKKEEDIITFDFIKYNGNRITNCEYYKQYVNIKKLKTTIVYCLEEESSNMKDLYLIFREKNRYSNENLKFAVVGKRNYKYLITQTHNKNLLNLKDFKIKKIKLFSKLVTLVLIKNLINNNSHLFSIKDIIRDYVNKDFGNKLTDLRTYINNLKNIDDYRIHSDLTCSNPFIQECIDYCINNRLYDYTIYGMYLNVLKEVDKFIFLKDLTIAMYYFNEYDGRKERMISYVRELLKNRGFKLDITNKNKEHNNE